MTPAGGNWAISSATPAEKGEALKATFLRRSPAPGTKVLSAPPHVRQATGHEKESVGFDLS